MRRLPETNWRRRSLPPLRSPNPPYVPLRPSSKRGSVYASSLPPPRYPSPPIHMCPSDPLREEKHGIQALCVRTRNPPSIPAPQALLKKKSRPSSAPPVPNRMPDQILLFKVPGFWEIFVAVKVFYRCPYFRNNKSLIWHRFQDTTRPPQLQGG